MPEPEAILAALEEALHETRENSPLHGKRVVVTAGPTREKIDGVRFISNYSSGKMGFAIARAASKRGALVTLIAGPVHLPGLRQAVLGDGWHADAQHTSADRHLDHRHVSDRQ